MDNEQKIPVYLYVSITIQRSHRWRVECNQHYEGFSIEYNKDKIDKKFKDTYERVIKIIECKYLSMEKKQMS